MENIHNENSIEQKENEETQNLIITEEKKETAEQNKENSSEGNTEKGEYEGVNFENRLQVPFLEKQRGDEFLKKEDYDSALRHYSKVIISIKVLQEDKTLTHDSVDFDKLVRTYGIPANLNMAYIYNKKKDYKSVVSACTKVIEYDPNNVKAIYRRSMAYINLSKYENADKDIEVLEDLIPRTKELEDLISYMEKHQKKSKENNDMIYKKMYKKFVETKITNEQKEIKKRFIDVIYNIPKAAKIIVTKAYEKTIAYPISYIANTCKTITQYTIGMCRKRKRN